MRGSTRAVTLSLFEIGMCDKPGMWASHTITTTLALPRFLEILAFLAKLTANFAIEDDVNADSEQDGEKNHKGG